MMKVANGSCIRELSRKSLRASKSRNIVAVCAIALTTILFTVLFTVLLSLNSAIQESTFRQVGGRAHGGYKFLTKEQADELKGDSLIKEYGMRHFLGMAEGECFAKTQVEIGYCDENYAEWSFCMPEKGRLPKEGTNEAVADTEVLHLLGVEPELGAEFTIPILVGDIRTERTFTLCGWWENDPVAPANYVFVPDCVVQEVLTLSGITETDELGLYGSWTLDVMLANSFRIEHDLLEILLKHDYDPAQMNVGVNWGYTATTFAGSLDVGTVIAVGMVLLLMMGTGYLIIYNIFQISVVGDIRFYGLLKTIGTTQKQIKRMIRNQAMLLSLVGIPVGMFLGWLVGVKLTPVVLGELNVVAKAAKLHPLIFLFAAAFALLTVMISCNRPGRVAAAISPVEALRYTEGRSTGRTTKKGNRGSSLFGMAKDNLARNKSKTIITIVSMALSVVLLNLTVVFSNGLDMDKYVSSFSNADFLIADAIYFRYKPFHKEQAVSQETVDLLAAQDGVELSAAVFGNATGEAYEYLSEEQFRTVKAAWQTPETVEQLVEDAPRSSDGSLGSWAQILGMEAGALSYLETKAGDSSKLLEPGGRYIAAVTGELRWAEVGDTVVIGYGDRLVEYEVAAVVSVPYSMGYRYHNGNYYVMNAETFCNDSQTADILYAVFDVAEEKEPAMEQFLELYTEHTEPGYDYESKFTVQEEFEGTRTMYLVVGGVLSFIVGMIGVLNFSNAILTGILTRKREFAMLQSIGMTGRQLKTMLVAEGLMYAGGAAGCATVVSLLLGPFVKKMMHTMFWFFTYRPTVLPVVVLVPVFVLLGVTVPMVMYRIVAKQTIVERLRESEN